MLANFSQMVAKCLPLFKFQQDLTNLTHLITKFIQMSQYVANIWQNVGENR